MEREEQEEDQLDARELPSRSASILKKFKPQKTDKPHVKEEPEAVWESGCAMDSETYNMSHERRGVALIFNHNVFNRMNPRQGTEKDCKDITKEFTKLGFEVRVYHDFGYKELKVKLEETAREDHTDADCLAVVVMTHGEPGLLFTRDVPYREQELWYRFTGDKCVSLLGKPKLFFIQACRGEMVDSGVRVTTTVTDAVATTYMIPMEADILISYSTVPGYYSWRNPLTGSWYIQSLCNELHLNGKKRDLLTILTFVNRRVAIDYMSNVPNNARMDMKNQMPAVTSMLTRLVYFHDNDKKTIKR